MSDISKKQINAAWADLHKDVSWGASERELHEQYRDVVLAYFAKLGIVQCEGCGGRARGWIDNDSSVEWSYEAVCPDCGGNGWVKHE